MNIVDTKLIPMQVIRREDTDQKVLMIFLGVMAILVSMGLLFLDVAVPFLKNYSVPTSTSEETEEMPYEIIVNV